MSSLAERYENGEDLKKEDIIILLYCEVFWFSQKGKRPIYKKHFTNTFKENLKERNMNRLLKWIENEENGKKSK